jgi:hypothetical protein
MSEVFWTAVGVIDVAGIAAFVWVANAVYVLHTQGLPGPLNLGVPFPG